MKLLDLLSIQDGLRSLTAQLVDSAAADELDQLISRHSSTSAEVEAHIKRLRDMLKSWDDVRADMEACATSLSDARQMLTDAVPENHDDLQCEADKLQVALKTLTFIVWRKKDERLATLSEKVPFYSPITLSCAGSGSCNMP